MILCLKEFETFPAKTVLKKPAGEMKVDFDSIIDIHEIQLSLSIQNSGEEYFCQGELTAEIDLECSRCLGKFKKNLLSRTDFIVCSQAELDSRKDVIDSEDYVVFKDESLKVDLSEIVRQSIVLEITLKPLCREDCLGLCSQCGQNLNEQSCDCKKDNYDTRWEGLKQLSSTAKKEGK